MAQLVVFGAGGLAHQIVDHVPTGTHFVTDAGDGNVCGIPVEHFNPHSPGELVVAVTAIEVRRRVVEHWHGDFGRVVAPSAEVSPHATLAEGVIVCRQAVIEAGCAIGAHSHVNVRGVVGHGSQIGRSCTVGPGAIICGNCVIGDEVYIGAGAIVREELVIGAGAFIAMGSLVTKDAPPGARVIGGRVLSLHAVDRAA